MGFSELAVGIGDPFELRRGRSGVARFVLVDQNQILGHLGSSSVAVADPVPDGLRTPTHESGNNRQQETIPVE